MTRAEYESLIRTLTVADQTSRLRLQLAVWRAVAVVMATVAAVGWWGR